MIFCLNADQNLVAEHYIIELYMILKDFDTIFPLYGGSKRGCRALWKRMGDRPYSYDKEQK